MPAMTNATIERLPKAELHLHLEGAVRPETLAELARRHGAGMSLEDARALYAFRDFDGFLEAFKRATALLRAPEDYALAAERLAAELARQGVVYAELNLSVGVMLWRNQDAEANFAAICRAVAPFASGQPAGLRCRWIFDAVRQFGPEPAMAVARLAAKFKGEGVVAFGIGGDETAMPAGAFRAAYDFIREEGLRPVIHAGETGTPEMLREAVEATGAVRVGHGIAAMADDGLQKWLAARGTVLELCPTSNLRTGALASQLDRIVGAGLPRPLRGDVKSPLQRAVADYADHPLPRFLRRGIGCVLATDDPAMFGTTLTDEYRHAAAMGLSAAELVRLARASFEAAFLPEAERNELLAAFDSSAASVV
jgi:aminodeoxyfutalosine deaminase